MCTSFPTLVNCEYFFGGVGKNSLDTRSAICILSQNIVNEKIYLILWFWHILLFVSSGLMFMYRCITTFVPCFRQYELFYRARKGTGSKDSKTIEHLSKAISLSEWLILCQIGRNHLDSRQFNDFIKKITNMAEIQKEGQKSSRKTNVKNNSENINNGQRYKAIV